MTGANPTPLIFAKTLLVLLQAVNLNRPNFLPVASLIVLFLLSAITVRGQTVSDTGSLTYDSLFVKDTATVDTLIDHGVAQKPANLQQQWEPEQHIPYYLQALIRHAWFPFGEKPVAGGTGKKIRAGNDVLFYVLVSLVIFFGLLRLAFYKYFSDLFRVLFRTSMKQRQIREQLMQTPLPSLLFNLFFVISGGLYITFLLQHFGWIEADQLWLFYLYSCAGLVAIYLVKYLVLQACGLLFNVEKAAAGYIFVVFIINKMIGIFLLPFLFLLGYGKGYFYDVVLVLSWLVIGILLFYRLVLGFQIARKEVRFNLFHFIVYFLAFEATPLLLIYRLLLRYFQ